MSRSLANAASNAAEPESHGNGLVADEEAGLAAVSDCAKEGGLAATRGAAPKNPVERKINQNVDITNG